MNYIGVKFDNNPQILHFAISGTMSNFFFLKKYKKFLF